MDILERPLLHSLELVVNNSKATKYTTSNSSDQHMRTKLEFSQYSSEINKVLVELNDFNSLTQAKQKKLCQKALKLIEQSRSYSLLITLLRLNSLDNDINIRADALAAVLNVADESHPLFSDLIHELGEGERVLVLGVLIEASRLEPDNELRLWRLKRLTSVIPKGSRSLYWSEAEELSKAGGDDAQLALLGFVRQLPESAQALTFDALKQSIQKVSNPFKKAMAFASLSEFVTLSQKDINDAEQSAAQIPNSILRVMTTTRLRELKSQASD